MSRFEIKIVVALLLIAVIPLAASIVLVGQVIRVSDSVTEGQTRQLAQPLSQAADAYRRLFEALKTGFKLRADLLSRDPALLQALQAGDRAAVQARLDWMLQQDESNGRLVVLDPDGGELARSTHQRTLSSRQFRDLEVQRPLGSAGHSLQAVFLTPRKPFSDFRQLGQAQAKAFQINYLRDELATYYRVVFFAIFGAVVVVALGVGLIIARITARRVAILAQATRKVAEGDLDTRVHLRTRDEMGDLAQAFNEMVRQIKGSRERIAYLEKIGAWQEIARRLAHEIKNPLTPIQLAVQQLHRKYDGGDEHFASMLQDAFDIVSEEVEGLRRLVQAFSSFAKLPDVQPEPVDLNALMDDFLKSRSEMQEMANVRWSPLEPTVTVMVDRMLIKHALFNLVENAVHAAEEAGTLEDLVVTITPTLDRPRQWVSLAVADNGPGMPPGVYRRIFDPYFTTKESGTGLGLAIVKKIVLEHDGTVSVTSAPGEGTCFIIYLPLVD
jgi:nitrogen fixation/metabolism regulation signal transduction histidine kinase